MDRIWDAGLIVYGRVTPLKHFKEVTLTGTL